MSITPLDERTIKSVFIRKVAPGIVENIIKDNATITGEDVLEMKAANQELCEDEPYCVLIDAGSMTSFTREAMEMVASKSFQQRTIAKAILINSLGHKILANFYLKVNRPHIKTKIFNNREEALNWLKKITNDMH